MVLITMGWGEPTWGPSVNVPAAQALHWAGSCDLSLAASSNMQLLIARMLPNRVPPEMILRPPR